MSVQQTHLFIFGIFIGLSFAFIIKTHTYWTWTKIRWETRDSSKQQDKVNTFDNSLVTNQLYNEVKVLCWIMISSSADQEEAINLTWGRRCNTLLFMSMTMNDEIDATALPNEQVRENVWSKTKEALTNIYEYHLNDYDWFLKADDDTFVIIENLRFMLSSYPTDIPIYFGGGAAYVLSREAVRVFVEVAIPGKEICTSENDGRENTKLGKCLENVNVTAVDSRDSEGRHTFFPFFPALHILPTLGDIDSNNWNWNYTFNENNGGLNCSSNHTISFRCIDHVQMHVLDYLIYQLRPYGIS